MVLPVRPVEEVLSMDVLPLWIWQRMPPFLAMGTAFGVLAWEKWLQMAVPLPRGVLGEWNRSGVMRVNAS